MNEDEVAAALLIVGEITNEMGSAEASAESILVDPGASAPDVLLRSDRAFSDFIGRFSIRVGCIPYDLSTVRRLTVREFCERYVADSFPEPPQTALDDRGYTFGGPPRPPRRRYESLKFPICFILGCGRSGTTLFRAMLDVHNRLWAPGELHLARFDTMADRAAGAGPFLRRALVPEVAARFNQPTATFGDRLDRWERDHLPTTEVYRRLHEADPQTLIVDKTPTYSSWPADLEWITSHFENARFIHIIRNPHDVIRSIVRMQLYRGAQDLFEPDRNPYQIAEALWVGHNTNIGAAFANLPAERTLLVRFEELVADPAVTLSGVSDLLDVPHDPAMADPYGQPGRFVARGAGDPRVNLLTGVERREPGPAIHRLGRRSRDLGLAYGYDC